MMPIKRTVINKEIAEIKEYLSINTKQIMLYRIDKNNDKSQYLPLKHLISLNETVTMYEAQKSRENI